MTRSVTVNKLAAVSDDALQGHCLRLGNREKVAEHFGVWPAVIDRALRQRGIPTPWRRGRPIRPVDLRLAGVRYMMLGSYTEVGATFSPPMKSEQVAAAFKRAGLAPPEPIDSAARSVNRRVWRLWDREGRDVERAAASGGISVEIVRNVLSELELL